MLYVKGKIGKKELTIQKIGESCMKKMAKKIVVNEIAQLKRPYIIPRLVSLIAMYPKPGKLNTNAPSIARITALGVLGVRCFVVFFPMGVDV